MKNTMKKGFTLIEMLFLTALIAIIAGIGIYTFHNDYVEVTDNKTAKLSLKLAKFEAYRYFEKNKSFEGFEFEGVTVAIAERKNFCLERVAESGTYRFNAVSDVDVVKGDCSSVEANSGESSYVPSTVEENKPTGTNSNVIHGFRGF